jgi:hypothetical protein
LVAGELWFQPVAQGHQLINSFDDAVLFWESIEKSEPYRPN